MKPGDRYGEGRFKRKNAMLVITIEGSPNPNSARGVNGPIDDLLFSHYP
jgi:NAD(P)H dehydrogenase (quinone)